MIQNTVINDKYLREFSPIPLNFNLKEIHNYIKYSEVIWLKPLIGDDLYDELVEQVANNSLTQENSTLLVEAIWPYLGFCVVYESLPFIWSHVSEVGITKGKSDNSDSLELKDLTLLQNHLRAQVEARKDYLKKWLCERNEYFPTLDCCSCGCSCCNDNANLNKPNPMFELYSPKRRCTTLI